MPMPAAAATSSGMRQAPSPNEKLVCVCRWTKLMPARSVERPLERPRLGDAVVAQVEHASRGAHAPVRAAHAAAVLPPARLDDPRLEHTLETWIVETGWWKDGGRVSSSYWRVRAAGRVFDLRYDRIAKAWALERALN